MVVGVCQVRLAVFEGASLKQKRSVVRRIVSRVRTAFNVAVAEVADQDDHAHAVLGFAVVGNDHRVVNAVIDRVVNHIEGLFLADIEDHRYEILHIE